MKKTILVTLILAFFVLIAIFAGIFFYKNQTSYFSVGEFAVVNGKLTYKAAKFTGQEVIVYDGKEYGKEYDSIYHIKDIGGKLTFSAYRNVGAETNHYIIYGNEIIGDTEKYYRPSYPVEVNGKIAFEAYFGGSKSERNGKSRIVYNGQVYGEEYDWASKIADIDGKLAYVGKRGRETYIVYDGIEKGEGENPTSVNGTLTYLSGNKVIFGEKIIEGDYDSIQKGYGSKTIYEIDGKPAFAAIRDGKSFVVYDGKEYGKEYNMDSSEGTYSPETVFIIYENNHKLTYSFVNTYMVGNENYLSDIRFVYDGHEIESLPFEYDGKMGYVKNEKRKDFIVIDDKIVSPGYRDIAFVVNVEGKLIYIAKKFIGYSIYST